tara:strand:+ start:40657 stop:41100 length:444 start_codon:yes stop_codon:yes gene_type:complete
MRKVETQTVYPFLNNAPARVANSETDGVSYKLHGNVIARHVPGGIMIGTAGWETRTTGSRLRAILSAYRPDVKCYSLKGSLGLSIPTAFENGLGRHHKRVEFAGKGRELFVAQYAPDVRDGTEFGSDPDPLPARHNAAVASLLGANR